MKKAITLLVLFCIAAFAQQKGTFTDTRDGKTYKTAKIGEQVWMAENLNYEAKGSECYSRELAYCVKYGRLYNWAMAMALPSNCNNTSCSKQIETKHQGICPSGWHIPSNAEWDKLIRYVDGDKGTESLYESETAGKYLKATSGWDDYKGKSCNGEDTYGFSALPGGNGGPKGYFFTVGNYSNWWSSSEGSKYNAYYRAIRHEDESISYEDVYKLGLFSVRCLQD
ncbi:MAG: fibrobacter succinogenes major paralogous domain-containing protein [Fibromonadaceae bacterium]|jgi:uncharacterized protein (TIGR02145 family)|nr:fibrobacter succinogenes major paralogous domain-containing protein [Fibromonadaceae bacterium]